MKKVLFPLGCALLVALLALAACGGSGTSPSSPPTGTPPTLTPSPTSTAGLWQPGTDPLAATAEVATQWPATLSTERFAASDIWSPQATFDLWASEMHVSGGAAVKDVYVGAAPDSAWTAGHALVTPGVAAYEGLFTQSGQEPTAALDLLAVSGGRIAHEEIYLDTSGSLAATPVTQWPSAPTFADTVARTKKTATAFADAVSVSSTLKMGLLLADDVLFYDTAQKRERRGATALLRWWSGRTAWTSSNKLQDGLVVGRGWAAIRWTATGGQTSTDDITMPSATVLEIRSGKVVRMTLYYDSATLQLHL
jgi:ketosteroid isomerase-like protein